MRFSFAWPFSAYTDWTDTAITNLVGQEVPITLSGEEMGRGTVVEASRLKDNHSAAPGLWITIEVSE